MKAKAITFASRLQELLDEKGITGYKLAALSGMHRQAISRILRGEQEPGFGSVVQHRLRLGKSLSAFDCVTVIKPPTTRENSNE